MACPEVLRLVYTLGGGVALVSVPPIGRADNVLICSHAAHHTGCLIVKVGARVVWRVQLKRSAAKARHDLKCCVNEYRDE